MAVMSIADHFRVLPPDNFNVGQRSATFGQCQHASSDSRTTRFADSAFNVTEVDKPVFFEIRMQNHIAEATMSQIVNVRHAPY